MNYLKALVLKMHNSFLIGEKAGICCCLFGGFGSIYAEREMEKKTCFTDGSAQSTNNSNKMQRGGGGRLSFRVEGIG